MQKLEALNDFLWDEKDLLMVKKDRMRAAMLIGATNATVHLPSTVLGDYKKFVNRALSDQDAMEKLETECHCLEGNLDWLQSFGPWVTCTSTLSYASYKPEIVKLFKTFLPPLIQDLNRANPGTMEFNIQLCTLRTGPGQQEPQALPQGIERAL